LVDGLLHKRGLASSAQAGKSGRDSYARAVPDAAVLREVCNYARQIGKEQPRCNGHASAQQVAAFA